MFIKVKVSPNSKKEEIIKKAEDSYEIRTREKPIEGRANRAVLKALTSYFKISESRFKLVKGSKKRNKIFEIK